jgi:hypothetical protein
VEVGDHEHPPARLRDEDLDRVSGGPGSLLDHDLRSNELAGGSCVVDNDPDLEPHLLTLAKWADRERLVGSQRGAFNPDAGGAATVEWFVADEPEADDLAGRVFGANEEVRRFGAQEFHRCLDQCL